MSDPRATEIRDAYDRRISLQGNWRITWEDLAHFLLPQQVGFQTYYSPGNERTRHLYDGVGLRVLARWGKAAKFAMMPPKLSWFTLRFADPGLNEVDAAKEWLENCQRRMEYAIRYSNFDKRMSTAMLMAGAFGNLCMDAEESSTREGFEPGGFRGLNFRLHNLACVGPAENADGVIDDIIVLFKLTYKQAMEMFGKDQLSETTHQLATKAAQEQDSDYHVKILHAVMPRNPKDVREPNKNGTVNEKHQPYASIWVDYDGGKKIRTSGYYELPRFFARTEDRSLDIYGSGPGELALPDIRTVNEAQRLDLAAWEKAIDPPMYEEGNQFQSKIDLRAAGVTQVGQSGKVGQWPIAPYTPHLARLERKYKDIEDVFHYNEIMLPDRREIGEMREFEVMARVEQIYSVLGSDLWGLTDELFTPVLERTFSLMLRRNAFFEMPEVLQGQPIDVEFIGPIGRAQRADERHAVRRWVENRKADAQVNPEALDMVDWDGLARYEARQDNVPAEVQLSQRQIEQRRRQRQELQQRQLQLQLEQAGAETLKTASDAIGQDRVVQLIAEGQGGA